MVKLAAVLGFALLALSGCGDPGPAQIPTTRYLEQNAPSNRDFQPPGSLPRGF